MVFALCKATKSNAVTGQMGIMVEGHEGVRPGRTNEESDRTHPSTGDLVPGLTLGAMTRYGPESRWFDVYTRGNPKIHWTTAVPHDWVKLSSFSGELTPGDDDECVRISIEWDQVDPHFDQKVLIDIRSAEGDFEQVHLPINGRRLPATFKSGFVEGDGYISIPAASCTIDAPYRFLPDVGNSITGSVSVDAISGEVLSYLTYNVFAFTESSTVDLLLYFNMTLDLDPTDTMSYDVMVDGSPGQTHQLHRLGRRRGGCASGWLGISCTRLRGVRRHGSQRALSSLGSISFTTMRHSNLIPGETGCGPRLRPGAVMGRPRLHIDLVASMAPELVF